MFKTKLSCDFKFEAAHTMPNFPKDHPNSRVHGHSYSGEVVVEGFVNAQTGFVMDHSRLNELVDSVVAQLDHRLLNEVPELELPTGEHISRWIWNRLKPQLPQLCEVVLRRPSVGVTVHYSGGV